MREREDPHFKIIKAWELDLSRGYTFTKDYTFQYMHINTREKTEQMNFHCFYYMVSPSVILVKYKTGIYRIRNIYILTHGLWATRPSPSSQQDSHHILKNQMPGKESIRKRNQVS